MAMSPEERNRIRRERWAALSEEEKEREREKQREQKRRHREAHPEYWEQRNKERGRMLTELRKTDPEVRKEHNAYMKEWMKKRTHPET